MMAPQHRTVLVNLDPDWNFADLVRRFLLDLTLDGRERRLVLRSVAASGRDNHFEHVWGARWPRLYSLAGDSLGSESLLDDLIDDVQHLPTDVVVVLPDPRAPTALAGLDFVERFVESLDPALRHAETGVRRHAVVRLAGPADALLPSLDTVGSSRPSASFAARLLHDRDRAVAEPCERLLALQRRPALPDDAATTVQFLTLRAIVDLIRDVRAQPGTGGGAPEAGYGQPLRAFLGASRGRTFEIGAAGFGATRSEQLAATLAAVHAGRREGATTVDPERDRRWSALVGRFEDLLDEAERATALVDELTAGVSDPAPFGAIRGGSTFFQRRRLRRIAELQRSDAAGLDAWGRSLAEAIESASARLQRDVAGRHDGELRRMIAEAPMPEPGEAGGTVELVGRRKAVDELHIAWLARADEARATFEAVQPPLSRDYGGDPRREHERIVFRIEAFPEHASYRAAFEALGVAAGELVPLRYVALAAVLWLAAGWTVVVELGARAGAPALWPAILHDHGSGMAGLVAVLLAGFVTGNGLLLLVVARRRRRYREAREALMAARETLIHGVTEIARAAWRHMLISSFTLYPELALARIARRAAALTATPLENAMQAVLPRGNRAALPGLRPTKDEIDAVESQLVHDPAPARGNWVRGFMLAGDRIVAVPPPARLSLRVFEGEIEGAVYEGTTAAFLSDVDLAAARIGALAPVAAETTS